MILVTKSNNVITLFDPVEIKKVDIMYNNLMNIITVSIDNVDKKEEWFVFDFDIKRDNIVICSIMDKFYQKYQSLMQFDQNRYRLNSNIMSSTCPEFEENNSNKTELIFPSDDDDGYENDTSLGLVRHDELGYTFRFYQNVSYAGNKVVFRGKAPARSLGTYALFEDMFKHLAVEAKKDCKEVEKYPPHEAPKSKTLLKQDTIEHL